MGAPVGRGWGTGLGQGTGDWREGHFPAAAQMEAPGAGPGPGASPGLEAALQKLALRRKKVLSAEEMELYELVQAAGGSMDPDVFTRSCWAC